MKPTDKGKVVLHASKADGEHAFEVRDTGPGIAPDQRAAMFQPFQLAASGLARGGTGLGLAIAQRHVALMGGSLELVSAPGQGARFSFCLVLPDPASAPVTEPPEEGAALHDISLPADLRRRLREAVQMHNATEVKRCLEDLRRLGKDEARPAGALTSAVQRFDLKPLIRMPEAANAG